MPLTEMVRCRAVLFDLDGVLADSVAAVRRAWTRWAIEQGLEPGAVLGRLQHGMRAIDQLRLLAPELDAVQEDSRFSAYEAADTEGVTALPGAVELLASLPPDRWAVVTSGPRAVALARLRAIGAPVPRVLAPADEVQRGKPDPEGYLLGARLLGVAPADCLVFEDAPAGVVAGKGAGAQVVALLTSHPAEDLPGADRFVPNLSVVEFRGMASDYLELGIDRPVEGQRGT